MATVLHHRRFNLDIIKMTDSGWVEYLNRTCIIRRRLVRGDKTYEATVERAGLGLWGWKVFVDGVCLGVGTNVDPRSARAEADKVLQGSKHG